MKQLIIILLTIFFGFFYLNGQTSLTKNEILISWKSLRIKEKFGDVTFDKGVNSRIKLLADSLHKTGIDSIMIYGISYPGLTSIGNEKCIPYTKAYIIWPSNGNLNIIFLKGNCELIDSKIDSLGLFTFYNINKEIIEMEEIMPVILGAEKNKKNEIAYSMSSINHEL